MKCLAAHLEPNREVDEEQGGRQYITQEHCRPVTQQAACPRHAGSAAAGDGGGCCAAAAGQRAQQAAQARRHHDVLPVLHVPAKRTARAFNRCLTRCANDLAPRAALTSSKPSCGYTTVLGLESAGKRSWHEQWANLLTQASSATTHMKHATVLVHLSYKPHIA